MLSTTFFSKGSGNFILENPISSSILNIVSAELLMKLLYDNLDLRYLRGSIITRKKASLLFVDRL